MALRVVNADDNFLVRRGTAALLGASDDVDLVRVVTAPVVVHAMRAREQSLR